jgi:alkylation response protein AidB-like acyl-CoA dehydrogenase
MNTETTFDPVARARALEPIIRQHADAAERQRHLSPEVAQAMAAAGLYRIAAPRRCGGHDADPMTQIATIEAVSTIDGSTGWNLMIGVESFGLIAPAFVECADLLADPMTILCSSTAAICTADETANGFRVNGQWQFVSGCHNAKVFAGLVARRKDGAAIPGLPPVYAVVELPDFEIVDTWDVGGLRGSGSHDVRITNVEVPNERILAQMGRHHDRSPLEHFPLGSRLAYNKVGVALGIARAAVDAFTDIATGKVPRFTSKTLRERPFAQRALAQAEVRVRGARSLVFELVEEMWTKVKAHDPISLRERALFQIACSDAAAGAVEAVEAVSEAAGTTANFRSGPLERLARDVRVVRQHVTVAPQHIEDGGRVLLGLEPEGPLLRMQS